MERFTRHLRAIAAHLESATSEDRAEQLASRAVTRARVPQAQARRAVGVLAGIAVVTFGFASVGALADSSVPGQFLYPIDRAFEAVTGVIGVETGGSEERLTEALALIDRGDQVRAAELIDEAIEAASKETGLDGKLTEIAASPVATTPPTEADTGPIVLPADPDDEPEIVATAPADEPADTLRLATEALLRTVQEVKASDGDESLADALVAAASDAKEAATQVIILSAEQPVSESTTTTIPETTTTSKPGKKPTTTTDPDPTTTTTVPDGSTTTTTEPDDDSTGTTSTTDPGPIILPPQG